MAAPVSTDSNLPDLPPLIPIRRTFNAPRIDDVPAEMKAQLAGCDDCIQPGERIAIAVGSRGIANLLPMVREMVAWIKARGASPFLVPAMGSHGGATAEGQQAILEGYGLTEAAIGAPIKSSMETVELPQGDSPRPVYFDRNAYDADGTVLLNRIKQHTCFHGRHESGLVKMLVIGLGKRVQAEVIHADGTIGLRDHMPHVAKQILATSNVRMGVAIVENALDETMCLQAIPAGDILDREPELLDLARENMPSLPVDPLDLLIIEEMGKNISGMGMDPNIIGRYRIPGQAEPDHPSVRIIYIRGLTQKTKGNALGIGLADIMRREILEQIDFATTYRNLATTTFLTRGMLPLLADSDAHAMQLALHGCGRPADTSRLRICRIRNTLELQNVWVSPAVLDELAGRDGIEILGDPAPLLTPSGEMTAVWQSGNANARHAFNTHHD